MQKVKLIYNPNAGSKRRILPGRTDRLEEIKNLLNQYQIPVEYFPTKKAGHAIQLAKDSIREKFDTVIAAGGDGTVSEVANGLIGTDVTLGILPLGTFMNICRMLSIPTELEKAVMLLKIARTRKIDVGCITKLDGEKLSTPYYFMETAGLGLDAEFHQLFKEFEEGNKMKIFEIVKMFFNFYSRKVRLVLDGKEEEEKATLISIANGPYTGAALNIAPEAKLNDHRLTVGLYKMSKWELILYFMELINIKKTATRKLEFRKAEKIVIKTEKEQMLHADGSMFGTTPAEFKVIPSALNVICGFPLTNEEPALVKRNEMDP